MLFPQRKGLKYSLNRRQGKSHSWSRGDGEQKSISPFWNLNSCHPGIASHYWLSWPSSTIVVYKTVHQIKCHNCSQQNTCHLLLMHIFSICSCYFLCTSNTSWIILWIAESCLMWVWTCLHCLALTQTWQTGVKIVLWCKVASGITETVANTSHGSMLLSRK
jgi:hypothetical protein